MVLFGALAAERLAFGEITSGAENDLHEATNLARRMVRRWGMCDSLGDLVLDGEAEEYGEYSAFGGREAGSQTLDLADAAVWQLLAEARTTAEGLLTAHRAILDTLAQTLLISETPTGEGIEELLAAAQPAEVHEALPREPDVKSPRRPRPHLSEAEAALPRV